MKKHWVLGLVLCLLGSMTACQPKKEMDLSTIVWTSLYIGSKTEPSDNEKILINAGESELIKTELDVSSWKKSSKSSKDLVSQAVLFDSEGRFYQLSDDEGILTITIGGSDQGVYRISKSLSDILSSVLEPLNEAVKAKTMFTTSNFNKANTDGSKQTDFSWFDLTPSNSDALKLELKTESWIFEKTDLSDPVEYEMVIRLEDDDQVLYFHTMGSDSRVIFVKQDKTITYTIENDLYYAIYITLNTFHNQIKQGASEKVVNAVYSHVEFPLIRDEEVLSILNTDGFNISKAQSDLAKQSLQIDQWIYTTRILTPSETYLSLTDTKGYITTLGLSQTNTSFDYIAIVTSSTDPDFRETYLIPFELNQISYAFIRFWELSKPTSELLSFVPETLSYPAGIEQGSIDQGNYELSPEDQQSVIELLDIGSWRIHPFGTGILVYDFSYVFTDSLGRKVIICGFSTLDQDLDLSLIIVTGLNRGEVETLMYMAPFRIADQLKGLLDAKYPRS